MLFLRRTAGESITLVQDRQVLGTIAFLRVDPEMEEIDLEVTTGHTRTHTLRPGSQINLYDGKDEEIYLKFSFVLRYDRYPPAASVGIEAPRSVAIYRSERLVGLGPVQIAALQRE